MNTATCAMPATARSAAEIAARSCAPLTNVVARPAPFQRTTEAALNPLPLTVSVNAAPPAAALAGDSEPRAGGPPMTVTGGAGRRDRYSCR